MQEPTTIELTRLSGWVDDNGPVPSDQITEFAPHLWPGLDRYMTDHVPTGGFLRAVLENDLRGAAARMSPDLPNQVLFRLVRLLNNYASAESWGSKEKVAAWLVKGGSDAVS